MTITSFTMLLLLSSPTPPSQEGVVTVLGPKAYRDGDVIEIADVTATSPRLEHGDSVTVRGHVHLKSRDEVQLCLYLTATEGDGIGDVDASQRTIVTKGQSEFELKTTIRNRGVLHLTFYDVDTGDAIGGTYFGTPEQMKDIADWDVGYYLRNNVQQPRVSGSFKRARLDFTSSYTIEGLGDDDSVESKADRMRSLGFEFTR